MIERRTHKCFAGLPELRQQSTIVIAENSIDLKTQISFRDGESRQQRLLED